MPGVVTDSMAWTVDLADLGGVDAFAERAERELGGIDILVNNAGMVRTTRLPGVDWALVEELNRTNYLAPVRLTLALLPAMLARGSRPDPHHLVGRRPPRAARRVRLRRVQGRALGVLRIGRVRPVVLRRDVPPHVPGPDHRVRRAVRRRPRRASTSGCRACPPPAVAAAVRGPARGRLVRGLHPRGVRAHVGEAGGRRRRQRGVHRRVGPPSVRLRHASG